MAEFWKDRDGSGFSSADPAWISRCEKCGESLSSSKRFVLETHKKFCSASCTEKPHANHAMSMMTLAFGGMALGCILAALSII